MPGVFKRRQEYIVAEPLQPGGTVSGKNGITPVAQGDMLVDGVYYAASDFTAQFEPVAYEDCPEDLKAVSDPERYEREQVVAAAKETAEAERRMLRGERVGRAASRLGSVRDLTEEAEERRAEEETGRVPTPGTQSIRDR